MYELAEVLWDDAKSSEGWHESSTVDELLSKVINECLCVSTGYLIRKNNKEVILTQGTNGLGSIDTYIRIPRGMVRKIKIYGPQSFKDERS